MCVFEWCSGYKRVFQIYETNRDYSPRLGPKNRPWAKSFERTVLGSYFTKMYDMLTKMNPQDVFYIGKMCTDHVQLNK